MKTKVIREIKIDDAKALKRWEPVIEKQFEGLSSEEMNAIALYCELHTINENAAYVSTPVHGIPGSQPASPSLLPLAIKILSKLNLKGKNIQVSAGPIVNTLSNGTTEKVNIPSKEVSVKMSRETLEEIKASSNLDLHEEYVVEGIVNEINRGLKYHDTIILYNILESISIIAEATMSPCIIARYRVAFLDRNTTKSPMYRIKFSKDLSDSYLESVEQFFDLDESFVKTTAEDGTVYWIDTANGKNEIVRDLYTEEDAHNLLKDYERRVAMCKASVKMIKDSFH